MSVENISTITLVITFGLRFHETQLNTALKGLEIKSDYLSGNGFLVAEMADSRGNYCEMRDRIRTQSRACVNRIQRCSYYANDFGEFR